MRLQQWRDQRRKNMSEEDRKRLKEGQGKRKCTKMTVVIPNSNRVPTTVSTGSTSSVMVSNSSTHLSQNAKEVAQI